MAEGDVPSTLATRSERGLTEVALQSGYGVRDGCTVRIEVDKEGGERVDVLATFTARIEEEITVDDGVETSRLFRISGRLQDGTRVRDALVPASEFEGLSWVLRTWGLRALMFSGGGRRDHLRTAIQLMSARAASRTVYTHTGWRQEGDDWIYLYQGGAVGADDIEVRLDGPFERFALPSQAEDVEEALALSLSLLGCGPPEVTVPLLAAVYAAPLSFILNPDFAVWVVGLTGSLKSELASLAQRHFGPFTRKTLPGSWSSTGNSLEALLSVTKDMLSVIDDFAPQADAQAQREQTKRAEVLLRNVGNHAGRGRLKPDLTQRPVRPPRGILVCTGEDHPPTPSIVARLVLVEVDRTRLNLPAITRIQNEGQRLPHAMRAYIEWLRPRLSSLKETLPRAQSELMTSTFARATVGGHMRAPSGLSTLHLGLSTLFDFAVDRGVVSAERAAELLDQAQAALLAIGRKQAEIGRGETTSSRFLRALATLISQGRVWLRTGDGVQPERHGPSTGFVGWRDRDTVYLLTEAAHRAVAAYLRGLREPLGLSGQRLFDALVKEGVARRPTNDDARLQLQFPSGRHRVVCIPAASLAFEEERFPERALQAVGGSEGGRPPHVSGHGLG
ncbi:MAG: hypothetical protein SFX73_08360 [Kofleriaceae bacterium]|nr:hypothetical protein [Kofleriaceae bacterium]